MEGKPGAGKEQKPGEGLQPTGQAVQTPGITKKSEFTVDRHMGMDELKDAPTGIVHSRFWSVEKDEFGNIDVKGYTPEGQAILDADVRAQTVKFGSYPGSDDPKAPKPPIKPGRRWFNPFSGQFGGLPTEDSTSVLDEYE